MTSQSWIAFAPVKTVFHQFYRFIFIGHFFLCGTIKLFFNFFDFVLDEIYDLPEGSEFEIVETTYANVLSFGEFLKCSKTLAQRLVFSFHTSASSCFLSGLVSFIAILVLLALSFFGVYRYKIRGRRGQVLITPPSATNFRRAKRVYFDEVSLGQVLYLAYVHHLSPVKHFSWSGYKQGF